MRRLTLLGILTGLLLAVPAAGASATTFAGACELAGYLEGEKPYRYIIENNSTQVFATGTCTGTLNGRPYAGPVHMYVDARMDSPMSCELVVGPNLPGVLTFGTDPAAVNAVQLDLRLNVLHTGPHMTSHISGAYNGLAISSLRSSNPDDARACAQEGAARVYFTTIIQTVTALYG